MLLDVSDRLVLLRNQERCEASGEVEEEGTCHCSIKETKRSIIFLQFLRLLDCLENWSGFGLAAKDGLGCWVVFVEGFKDAILPHDEHKDLNEIVGFIVKISPLRLVKGCWAVMRSAVYRSGVLWWGFLLLGGLEKLLACYRGIRDLRR